MVILGGGVGGKGSHDKREIFRISLSGRELISRFYPTCVHDYQKII
jgi:hypothetical protein